MQQGGKNLNIDDDAFTGSQDEAEVLRVILTLSDKLAAEDVEENRALEKANRGEYEDDDDNRGSSKQAIGGGSFSGEISKIGDAKRKVSGLSAMSGGGDGMLYAEFSSGK
jgi:hypothetical protein